MKSGRSSHARVVVAVAALLPIGACSADEAASTTSATRADPTTDASTDVSAVTSSSTTLGAGSPPSTADAAPSTSSAPDVPTSSVSTVPIDPTDVTRAAAAVVTIDDLAGLPFADWSSRPRDDTADEAEMNAIWDAIAEDEPACRRAVAAAEEQGVSITELEMAPEAPARGESPTFVTGRNESEFEHTVSVYPTSGQAAAKFASVNASGYIGCVASIYGEVMQAAFDRDGMGVVVTDAWSSVDEPRLGDESVRVRVALLLDTTDQSDVVLYVDVSAIRIDRVITSTVIFDVGAETGDPNALIALALGKTVSVWADAGIGEPDHLHDLASGETAVISRRLVDVEGYRYVDADTFDVAYSVLAVTSLESDRGGAVFHGFALHSVVADDPSQNTTRAGAGYVEVGFLRMYEFVEPVLVGGDRRFADEFCVGETLGAIEFADVQVFVYDDPLHPESRYHYCWVEDGIGGVIDGAERDAVERWLAAYLALPKLAEGETIELDAVVRPVRGFAYLDADPVDFGLDGMIEAGTSLSVHMIADDEGVIGILVITEESGPLLELIEGEMGLVQTDDVVFGGERVSIFTEPTSLPRMFAYLRIDTGWHACLFSPFADDGAIEDFLAGLIGGAP